MFPARRAHSTSSATPHLACKLLQGLWLVGPSRSFTVCFVYYLFQASLPPTYRTPSVVTAAESLLASWGHPDAKLVTLPKTAGTPFADCIIGYACVLQWPVALTAAVLSRSRGVMHSVTLSLHCHRRYQRLPLPCAWFPQIRRGHWGDPCGGTCDPHAIPCTSRTASPTLAQ